MTPITFKRYSPTAPDMTIVIERITHWFQIDYNGKYGTEIVLDDGSRVRVGEWPTEVEQKIMSAKDEQS